MWKGVIAFGSLSLPVKLYSAVQDKSIRFRLLDARTKLPVTQRMIEPDSGKVVDSDDVQKALQVSKTKMVVVEPEEIAKIEPKESRDIDVDRFVGTDVITHQWFERPYWLGPDGEDATKKYFALVDAMRAQEKEGFARWVMRKKEYIGALRVEGDYLTLITLRPSAEVIPASQLEAPGGRAPDKREVEMAHKLVESMEGKLDMSEFKDTYRARVLELVEAKARGKVVRFPKQRRRPTEDKSLEAMLRKSLATPSRARGRQSA
ncbi:MAG TPA: Ku protein [Gemmatimonadaceae bacterium]|nr:Ku protein [Gemmatimonadaceae bacterium]